MAKSFQIALSPAEEALLVDRIEYDFLQSKASHLKWAQRCAGWMQKWQGRVDPPGAGDEAKPNHTVPLVQWHVFGKWARDLQALLGDEAEITARATGPSDRAVVAKVGRWMTSRLFDQMEILNPMAEFEFRRILNGWAAAYRPWYKREFTTLVGGKPKQVCDYEGPGFFPLEPDDLMVPAERGVTSLQNFSQIIHRLPVTVDEIQRKAGSLYYDWTGKREFVEQLIAWANQAPSNDYTMSGQDPVREERERSEGVAYETHMMGRRNLWEWDWYGKWRMLKAKNADAGPDELPKRELFESDIVVRYIPGMKRIVGCQDLLQIYPKTRNRRPFVESTMIKDGSYRPKGFGALLEDLEDDATSNSRLFQAAGELCVWPIVFYKPGGGMRPGVTKLEPGMAIPTEDPQSVNVVKINPNLGFTTERNQEILATAERLDGVTDQSLGRTTDRPNAPRTATGQLALIEEGNVRAWLDATILREDWQKIVSELWALDCEFVPETEPGLFFRVTEEQANGLFDVKKGGAYMTAKEFAGKFDFSLRFAVTVWQRQAQKQEFAAFYSAAMQNPLVQQNPTAMWQLLNMLAKKFNVEFQDIIPKPPEIDRPKTPDEEWTEMLEGQTVNVNPQDDDQAHIQAHMAQAEDERKDPDRDVQAIGLLVKHIIDHQQQLRSKMLMQTMMQGLTQALTPNPQQQQGQAMLQHLQQMYQVQQGQQQQQEQPGQQGPPQQQGPPGAPPQASQAFGSQQAPQMHEGQL